MFNKNKRYEPYKVGDLVRLKVTGEWVKVLEVRHTEGTYIVKDGKYELKVFASEVY